MSPKPILRNVAKLLSSAGEDVHVFLEIHPSQDQHLLDSVAADIGTPPGLRVVADSESVLLLEDSHFEACISGNNVPGLDATTSQWVRSLAGGDTYDWYGCVTEVSLESVGQMPPILLGHYQRDEAEIIAAAISPKSEFFVLNSKQVLICDEAGDLYHYQLRAPGDEDDTVLFVRAVDCDTGLEFAKQHLRSIRAQEPGSAICGINTGLIARVA